MFNETRLLDCVSYGSEFGHEYSTRIVQLRNGAERRNANWSKPLGRFSVIYKALHADDHQAVIAAHMASMGSLIPFRFKNWADYKAEGEVIGEGTGSEQTLQLVKNYQFGPIKQTRIIKKPVFNAVALFADDLPVVASVDYYEGLVTFTAPAGAVITWRGEFDIPVRFENDRLDTEPLSPDVLACDVGLVEVRL